MNSLLLSNTNIGFRRWIDIIRVIRAMSAIRIKRVIRVIRVSPNDLTHFANFKSIAGFCIN